MHQGTLCLVPTCGGVLVAGRIHPQDDFLQELDWRGCSEGIRKGFGGGRVLFSAHNHLVAVNLLNPWPGRLRMARRLLT